VRLRRGEGATLPPRASRRVGTPRGRTKMYEKPAIVAVTRTGAYHERGAAETEEKIRASEKYGGERISAGKGGRKRLERIEHDRRERWTEKKGKGTFFIRGFFTLLIDNVSFEMNGARAGPRRKGNEKGKIAFRAWPMTGATTPRVRCVR